VIVAHGFSRAAATWRLGGLLAANGFIVAIPDQPTWTDAARNGRALAELLEKIRSGEIDLPIAPDNRAAMVGFSMGGLNTLIAASGSRRCVGWARSGGHIRRRRPGRKEHQLPGRRIGRGTRPWNRHGNAAASSAPCRPPFKLRVRGATHLDVEWPAIGWPTGLRADRSRTPRGLLALCPRFLEATLMGDAEASATIHRAATDPAIAETRGP